MLREAIEIIRSEQQKQQQISQEIDASSGERKPEDDDFEPKLSPSLRKLNDIASKFATNEKIIIVLLATEGYIDLLSNFLCYALSDAVNCRNLLIVTTDLSIVSLAEDLGIGTFHVESGDIHSPSSHQEPELRQRPAMFGTLSYQELIFVRTQIVYELLMLGYVPIVADIDTVWLSNPIDAVLRHSQDFPVSASSNSDDGSSQISGFDLFVTDDNGEICGCFVVINCTSNGIRFWQTIYENHRRLIESSRNNSNKLFAFSDSEQKILTQLIIEKKYKRPLSIRMLPKDLFPSGFGYFNLLNNKHLNNINTFNSFNNHYTFNNDQRSEGESTGFSLAENATPVIVHNNFLVGMHAKISRFRRFGLWRLNSTSPHVSCQRDSLRDSFRMWAQSFDVVVKDTKLPYLHIVLPYHNSVFATNTSTLLTQVITEGLSELSGSGVFYVENNPPSYISFRMLGVYELSIHQSSNTIMPLTAMLDFSNIDISVDVSLNRTDFACDMRRSWHQIANNGVLGQRLHSFEGSVVLPSLSDTTSQKDDQSSLQSIDRLISHEASNNQSFLHHESYMSSITEASESSGNIKSIQFTYHIKVLTFNRPKSLNRLLNSLRAAKYHEIQGDQAQSHKGRYNQSHIALDILIDRERHAEVFLLLLLLKRK